MLLVSVVHSDLEDRRSLVAKKCDCFRELVELVNAATAVLVPKQELLVVA